MASINDHIAAGRRHAIAVLDMRAAQQGDEAAMALAGGMIAGARNFLVEKYGKRATFNLLFGLADDLITPEIPVSGPEQRSARG